jgi:cobalamin-dependent methionine synthase I
MKVIDDAKPVISKNKVFRLLGQKEKALSERLSNKIDRQMADLMEKVRPKVLYTTKKVRKVKGDALTLESDVILKSARLSKALGRCDRVAFFLATVGKRVDDAIHASLHNKKLADASIYDAIGSAAVEATVEDFQNRMDLAVKGKKQRTTLRFSPGYCDWKIHEQKKIFSVLRHDLIDVDLNESCLMTPRKSVSGVFGIGDSELIHRNMTNPCRSCGMKKCIARRV